MTARFDLREQEWIPVRVGKKVARVGLRTLFEEAHEIDDMVLPVPPAAAGLWRILYAITARITGLDKLGDSADDWVGRRDRLVAEAGQFDPEAVRCYFDEYPNRFDLFDNERPWMQDPRLADECPKATGINKLVLGRPAGNNQVWFGHFDDLTPVPVPAAEAAWWLLAQLYFGPAGRCTSRVVNGQGFADCTAGPLRGVVSFHPVGPKLFTSLLAGLPDPSLGSGRMGDDRCPWEWTELPDPLKPVPALTWPGGMLTARNRHAVLLVPDSDGETVVNAYQTWAWRQPGEMVRDPYVIWRQSKQGDWYAQPADSTRALWRDLDALLLHESATRKVDRPLVIDGFRGMPNGHQIRLRAFGFDQDRQTRDKQWYTAVTPPITQWLEETNPAAAYGIGQLREAAEDIEWRMRTALRDAWREVVSPPAGSLERLPDGPWMQEGSRRYWPEAEREFWRLVEDEKFDVGTAPFAALAHRIVDQVTESQSWDPRVAKAISGVHAQISGVRPKKRKDA